MNEVTRLEKATWIWCDHSEEVNQYAQFIQDFTVEGDKATLYIAADMNYAAFVNGQYVPGFAYSDYPECRSIDTLDISACLRPGVNRLCVVGYCQVSSSHTYREGRPGVRFGVYAGEEAVALSSTATLARRAPDYEDGPMEEISPQLSYTFHYDAKGEDGWRQPGYAPDGSWHPAVVALTQASLRPRPLRPLTLEDRHPVGVLAYGAFFEDPDQVGKSADFRMQYAALAFRGRVCTDDGPLTLPDAQGIDLQVNAGDGLYTILDLGEEVAGLFELDIDLPQAAEIHIGFGEHLDDLRVRTNADNCHFNAVYYAKAGRQTFTHYHKRLAGRYLQLNIYAPGVKLYYVGLRPTMYPLPPVPEFDCGDMLMNKIYKTAQNTLHLCMHEHYEDCPWREQSMYAMDTRVQMLCGYYAFGETDMPRESIRLMIDGAREDGFFEMCAPSTFHLTIPSFSLAMVGSVKEYVEHSGDTAFAAEVLPKLARSLQNFLPQITDSGLLMDFEQEDCWNFYEWNPGLDGRWNDRSPIGRYAAMQALFIMAVEQYLFLCEKTGIAPFADDLPAMVARVRAACQSLWSEEKQLFINCLEVDMPDSELVQALMICAGVATEAQRDILLDKLAHPDAHNLNKTTPSYSLFKYDALMSQPEKYAPFVRRNIAENWGAMLFKGATTFWETFRGPWETGAIGSLCHGWAAVPVYVYGRYRDYVL